MDRYKVGEIIHIKIRAGIVVLEYLGRGLEGHLNLKKGDKYLRIDEDYTIDLNGGGNGREDAFREMYGKLIHYYGIDDNDINSLTWKYVPDDLFENINGWVNDTEMSDEDISKLFNQDVNVIKDLMDRYKLEPLTKEENESMKKFEDEFYDLKIADGAEADGDDYDEHIRDDDRL
jgi:hypothetical protein